ncbi:MAG: type II toxin-antitoxin system HipA family toxin [Bacteroidota bacterium]
MDTHAEVMLWGKAIGAISWIDNRNIGVFQYTSEFAQSNIQVSPIHMPLRDAPYEFPQLGKDAFKGVPGMLADSLPDDFGNAVINAWLARQGRSPESMNPVERLCYIGNRGMGALEFEPSKHGDKDRQKEVDIEHLVELAAKVLNERQQLSGVLEGQDDQAVIEDILRVGTSAGGARAKAIISWNPETGQFKSGQIPKDAGFEHWLIKFDGVKGSGDYGISDPQGYGKLEYTYYQMAVEAGITMSKCRLHEEGGRSHFMTRRFDRTDKGEKVHMQSLAALAHFNYKMPNSYSYEQCFQIMRKLELPMQQREQQFKRSVFNVIARNQDDHVKNIAFLMDKEGRWSLAPAYDITFAWNPSGVWTNSHQMSINGKRDRFNLEDLLSLGKNAGIKPPKAKKMVRNIIDIVAGWEKKARNADMPDEMIKATKRGHRLTI